MATPPTSIVVEASPLISFLKIDRFDLLSVYGAPLVCLNHVREEVRYFGQVEKLERLLADGEVQEVILAELNHLTAFESLRSHRPSLGAGECASIIFAHATQVPLIITDRAAKNEAKKRNIVCHTTEEVVVQNIRQGTLSVADADKLLSEWLKVKEGVTKVKSFAELLD